MAEVGGRPPIGWAIDDRSRSCGMSFLRSAAVESTAPSQKKGRPEQPAAPCRQQLLPALKINARYNRCWRAVPPAERARASPQHVPPQGQCHRDLLKSRFRRVRRRQD
jgi:hypothetical protein